MAKSSASRLQNSAATPLDQDSARVEFSPAQGGLVSETTVAKRVKGQDYPNRVTTKAIHATLEAAHEHITKTYAHLFKKTPKAPAAED